MKAGTSVPVQPAENGRAPAGRGQSVCPTDPFGHRAPSGRFVPVSSRIPGLKRPAFMTVPRRGANVADAIKRVPPRGLLDAFTCRSERHGPSWPHVACLSAVH
jgi:hypothetical protein